LSFAGDLTIQECPEWLASRPLTSMSALGDILGGETPTIDN
jgi:hypothetical protein